MKSPRQVMMMMLCLIAACGGEGNAPRELSLYFALGGNFSPSLSIAGWEGDAPDQNLAGDAAYFEVEFRQDGAVVLGALRPELVNADEHLYAVRSQELSYGDYAVVWRLIYGGAYDGDDAVLAETIAEVTLSADSVNVDLSSAEWSTAFDADDDGLANLDEVLLGTSLHDPDSDDDGITDSADAEPLVAETDDDILPQISDEAVVNPVIVDTDADDDGVEDAADVCPALADPGQEDLDGDGFGDACDADRDGDFVTDTLDTCPATTLATSFSDDPSVQTDDDADGYGVPCDCDDALATIHPGTGDAPDRAGIDSDCDGIDGTLSSAVFLTAATDSLPAAIDDSVVTDNVAQALAMAALTGKDVYAAGGLYTLPATSLPPGVSLYGGYTADFSTRTVLPDAPATVITVTSASAEGAGLSVSADTAPVVISGVEISAGAGWGGDVLVALVGGDITVDAVRFSGDANAVVETLVSAQGGNLSVDSADFRSAAVSSATGLALGNADTFIVNSVFVMGEGMNTTALSVVGGSLIAAHNTIDGGRHASGTAYGAVVSVADVEFVNNIFITMSHERQSSVRCSGLSGNTSVHLNGNLFLRFSADSSSGAGSGYDFAAYESCEGLRHFLDDEAFAGETLGELTADSNSVWSGTDIASATDGLAVVVDENYRLAAESPAVESGSDAGLLLAPWDRLGEERSAPTDTGAYVADRFKP